jgi:hypothetical protein
MSEERVKYLESVITGDWKHMDQQDKHILALKSIVEGKDAEINALLTELGNVKHENAKLLAKLHLAFQSEKMYNLKAPAWEKITNHAK